MFDVITLAQRLSLSRSARCIAIAESEVVFLGGTQVLRAAGSIVQTTVLPTISLLNGSHSFGAIVDRAENRSETSGFLHDLHDCGLLQIGPSSPCDPTTTFFSRFVEFGRNVVIAGECEVRVQTADADFACSVGHFLRRNGVPASIADATDAATMSRTRIAHGFWGDLWMIPSPSDGQRFLACLGQLAPGDHGECNLRAIVAAHMISGAIVGLRSSALQRHAYETPGGGSDPELQPATFSLVSQSEDDELSIDVLALIAHEVLKGGSAVGLRPPPSAGGLRPSALAILGLAARPRICVPGASRPFPITAASRQDVLAANAGSLGMIVPLIDPGPVERVYGRLHANLCQNEVGALLYHTLRALGPHGLSGRIEPITDGSEMAGRLGIGQGRAAGFVHAGVRVTRVSRRTDAEIAEPDLSPGIRRSARSFSRTPPSLQQARRLEASALKRLGELSAVHLGGAASLIRLRRVEDRTEGVEIAVASGQERSLYSSVDPADFISQADLRTAPLIYLFLFDREGRIPKEVWAGFCASVLWFEGLKVQLVGTMFGGVEISTAGLRLARSTSSLALCLGTAPDGPPAD